MGYRSINDLEREANLEVLALASRRASQEELGGSVWLYVDSGVI